MLIDIRLIRRGNELAATFLSLSANSTLLYFTRTERNQTVRSYSPMIMLSVCLDYAFCLASFITTMNTILDADVILMWSDSFLFANRSLPPQLQYIFVTMHLFCLGMGNIVVPVEYFFRFYLICRKSKISAQTLSLTLGIAAIPLTFTVALFVRGFVEFVPAQLHDPFAGTLLNDSIWWDPEGRVPNFVVTRLTNPYVIASTICVFIVVFSSYGLCALFGYRIYHELNAMRMVMSQRTRRLQKAMSWLLVAKALIPLLFVSTPTLLVLLSLWRRWRIPHMGMALSIAVCWIPAISPTATLLLLTSHRRRLLRLFGGNFRVSTFTTSKPSITAPYQIGGQSSSRIDGSAVFP